MPTLVFHRLSELLLLAHLLCAEAPAGTIGERWLIAQTVIYRMQASGQTVGQVIYAPGQYQGIEIMDVAGHRRYRLRELEENLAIAQAALILGPVAGISNFTEPGSGDWRFGCQLKYIEGGHYFYLCPYWASNEP